MNLTAVNLAKRIVEDVIYEPGPCIYPGSFKPAHKGHFEAVKDLASRSYIQQVYIVISQKEKEGITAQQSLKTWETYLKCEPIPKASVEISPYPSPVTYAYKFIEARPNVKPVYLTGTENETEDQNYFMALQKRFGDQVLTIDINEEFEGASTTTMLEALKTGNYEKFKTCVPQAVNLKGKSQELFKMLATTVKENLEPQQIGREAQLGDFLSYCYNLLDIINVPEVITTSDVNYAKQSRSFGSYNPSTECITVYISNRNLADILRTLAHELIHHKQNELEMLNIASGETGSGIENEANASAAMIMREYGRKNPHIYE